MWQMKRRETRGASLRSGIDTASKYTLNMQTEWRTAEPYSKQQSKYKIDLNGI